MQQHFAGLTRRGMLATLSGTMSKPSLRLEFAKRLQERMDAEGITKTTVWQVLTVDDETVRLWLRGKRMPRDEKMARLAKLLGTTPEFLRYGKRAGEATPGAMVISDDDERVLIEMYRTLPDWGKKSVRARVAELVENFTPKGPENPFSKAGKGTQ